MKESKKEEVSKSENEENYQENSIEENYRKDLGENLHDASVNQKVPVKENTKKENWLEVARRSLKSTRKLDVKSTEERKLETRGSEKKICKLNLTPRSSGKKKFNVKRNDRRLENKNSIKKMWENLQEKKQKESTTNVRKFIEEIEKKISLNDDLPVDSNTVHTREYNTDMTRKKIKEVGRQTKNPSDGNES